MLFAKQNIDPLKKGYIKVKIYENIQANDTHKI